MKNKISEMVRDKLFLVVLVLGLLTMVAAAGVMTMKRGNEQNPYMNMEEGGNLLAQDQVQGDGGQVAGASDADPAEHVRAEGEAAAGGFNPDTVVAEAAHENAAADVVSGIAAASGNGSYASDAEVQAVDSGLNAASALVLDFADTSRMAWPVRGNVILDYSMDTTIYFPTLDQYKCNPAVVIQGEISEPVAAPANARVLEAGSNEEIGNYLKLDFGNNYTAICGQLKEITVVEGEYLEKGQLMGYVAEPTKYYTIEGSNIYLQMEHDGQKVDPLDYLE